MDAASLSNNVTRVASPITVQESIDVDTKKSIADELRHELPTLRVLSPDGETAELYNKELVSWNLDVPGKPAVIVQPETTDDVSATITVSRFLNARVVIAGGRHGHDCLADDALVLDLSKMKKVVIDADARLVTVEGGCKLGDMDQACKEHGLAAVTGTNPDTGVVGLSTAGGGGYLTRKYGMAADNFVSAEVVLADGSVVVATKDNEHADLLWGLAGAGSNFGLVTKLTMRLWRVDQVFGGMAINVAPTVKRAKAVVTNWRDWILNAPRSVMSMAVLPCGAPVVPMAICETDPEAVPQAAGERCSVNNLPGLKGVLGGPLMRLTGKVGKSFGALLTIKPLKKMQYHTELQPMLESVQASGHYYDASCLVPSLSDEVISTLVEYTRVKNVNSDASIIIFPLGGAVSDAPSGSTAFWGGGRKKEAFWIIIEGKWTPDATGEKRAAVVGWVKSLRAALAAFDVSDTAHTLDGNMESELAGPGAIFGPNYERIQQVKAKYDPHNFWKCNRNVAPKQA